MSEHFCDPCAFEECQWRGHLVVDCPRFIPKPETNYEKLFGTPERAARTLTNVCQFTHGGELCDRCQCYLFGDCDRKLRLMSERSIYDALLEWLRGEGAVIDEPDTIRNELADGGLIADALAPVCVDEKERRAFERGRVHERFAQQIFKEAGMRGDA